MTHERTAPPLSGGFCGSAAIAGIARQSLATSSTTKQGFVISPFKLFIPIFLLLGAQAMQAQEPGRVTGTVGEARSEQLLPGITVVVVGTLYAAVTDAEGRFAMGPLPPGTYTVEVNALGYRPERRDVAVAEGEEVVVAFRLQPPEVTLESIEALVLRRSLQPGAGLTTRRLREINTGEIGEWLRVLPGGDAGRRGGLVFEPTIRGLWGNQIGVYVDGARFLAGSPYGLDTPLGLFDPYTISSLEVVEGPYALTWGAGALSAIHLETRDAAPSPSYLRGEAQLGNTSRLRAIEAAGALADSTGAVAYRLQGAYRTGDDYEDGDGQRVPADFRAVTVRGRASYWFARSARLVVHGGYQDRRDLDLPGGALDGGASEAADGSVRFQAVRPAGLLRALDAKAYWNRRTQALQNKIQLDAEEPLVAVETEHTLAGGRLAAHLIPVEGLAVEVGGDVYSVLHNAVRREDAPVPLRPETPVLQDARLTNIGLFASGTRTFGRVEATGAVRVDVVQARADETSAVASSADLDVTETNVSGAFALAADLSSVWNVSVGVGSVVRTADAYERFADRAPLRQATFLTRVRGNPALKPERSTQADLWLRATYPRLDVRLNAFVRRLSDYITIDAVTDEIIPPATLAAPPSYVNSTGTFYGVEASVRYALVGRFVTMRLGGSYLWGRDETLDKPALGVAPASVEVGWRADAPGNLFFFEILLRGVFEQERVAALRGETPTDGYVTADLRVGLLLPNSVSLWLGLDNLADAAYANHLNALQPLTGGRLAEPGRRFHLRLRYMF